MEYDIKNMDDEILKEIISWRYEDKYSEYNMDSYDKLKERGSSITKQENSNNYLCYFKNGTLVGYTNTTLKKDGNIFIGIGLAPKYCSKGLGREILNNTIKVAKDKYPDKKIVLQVRSWNERAIKCYEKVGFKIIKKYSSEDYNGIQTEYIAMEYEF